MGSDLFFWQLSVIFYYQSKWTNKLKKNRLIEARKLCNTLFIYDLNSTVVHGEFESNHCEKYLKELRQGTRNIIHYEAAFSNLDIKIGDEKFQVCL